ncbi:unnamed protein product [Pleuronectes platessa]|uniref:Uncharacterized protein n=1 Tax=Pleuronectes platessa TaxID=8262 RepID=A0A9N7U098_PLEPL|nr:unnamed protein product [Pleuronectes platessa]
MADTIDSSAAALETRISDPLQRCSRDLVKLLEDTVQLMGLILTQLSTGSWQLLTSAASGCLGLCFQSTLRLVLQAPVPPLCLPSDQFCSQASVCRALVTAHTTLVWAERETVVKMMTGGAGTRADPHRRLQSGPIEGLLWPHAAHGS